MLEDYLEVFIMALGKTTKNKSIGFIRKGANFIQTNHNIIQLRGYHRNIFVLDQGYIVLLKIFRKILGHW